MTRQQFVFGATVICLSWMPYLMGSQKQVTDESTFDTIKCKTLIADHVESNKVLALEVFMCGKAVDGKYTSKSTFLIDANGSFNDTNPLVMFVDNKSGRSTNMVPGLIRLEHDDQYTIINSNPSGLVMKDKTHSRIMTPTQFAAFNNEDVPDE